MTKPTSTQSAVMPDQEGSFVDLGAPAPPTGPYGMAKACEAKLAELQAEKDSLPRSKRKAINRRLVELRDLTEWCKTRAGYAEP